MKKSIIFSTMVISSLFADTSISQMKKELELQKANMQMLEQKIENLSKNQNSSVNKSASFSQKSYLPDIALILNMSAVHRDVKNSDFENFALPGFIDAGEAELPFNKDRGFNFNYAEVAMSSTVDPYFDAFAIFHLHPDEFEIEEAFIRTRALPNGFRLKAGKFRSAFGRLNEKHQHSWHFDSQAIIYKALFGPDMISDPGVQLQWVAPTDTYFMLGAEAFQGSNDRSFGDTQNNNLYVTYAKTSIDLSDELSMLTGVSYAQGKNNVNGSNPTKIYGFDLTTRYQLGSYSAITWQSEYLKRDKDIKTRVDKQAGLYSELIYQYNNNYSMGLRYDAITKNETDLSTYAGIDTSGLKRYTAMVEYHPFPMSRIRLSYMHDKTKIINNQRKDINKVMLSINIAAGAHGAHNY